MADLSDGFIALPGGIGTLDELFEIWTWRQLGLHAKPIGLLNVNGFFDPMLMFLDTMVESQFLKANHRNMLTVGQSISDLVSALSDNPTPPSDK
jgi:uncharacterized protein (TIGR00730 family)